MGNCFLYSINENNYLFDVRRLIKILLTTLDKVCYISMNKSAESLITFFKENQINPSNIVIVDMISSRFKKPAPQDNTYFFNVSNAKKTTDYIIDIIKKEKCEGLIIDSLSTMSIYYDLKELGKFAHDILIYSQSTRLITNMIIQKKDEEKDWVNNITPLVGGIKRLT